MIEKLINICNTYPNNVAYKVRDKEITYKELLENITNYSNILQKQGTEPVIIYGHKSINMYLGIVSCILAKRAYIPIDTGTPINRIENIIHQTNSSLMLTDEEISIKDIECIKINDLEKYEEYEVKEQTNDIAYIIFTSGSTGNPKGVPISYDNLSNFIEWISNLNPLNTYENINVLNQASFSFDLSVADLYYSLFNGHTLISIEKDNELNEIFQIIKDNNINFMVMTPTFIKMCLLNEEFNHENFSSIKCMYFCGEILDKKTVSKLYIRFPNIKIINAYGPTEATSAVSACLITKEMLDNNKSLPVGTLNDAAVSIVIEDDEIILKGKSVFKGYLNDIIGGYFKENNIDCYKTGDLGYIEDNKLYYICRKDNQIKYKGYRIELDDIEANINKIKGVINCAVICKFNDDNLVKAIKAYVVLEPNISIDYVKEELNKTLPTYMIPKIIKEIDELPINQNGKIDRKLLSEL